VSSGEWSGAPPSLHYWVCIFLSILMKLKYTPKLKEIENTLQIWSKQILTPIGKITIIKSLIISKLKHLFLTISSPKENIINQLVSKIYSFIWDNKPDKIKREVLSQNCDIGGLKMLNIKMYIKDLK
jgi:CRISPR/Cas system endoribonuclease Cas6 (RAMP superfamily)